MKPTNVEQISPDLPVLKVQPWSEAAQMSVLAELLLIFGITVGCSLLEVCEGSKWTVRCFIT